MVGEIIIKGRRVNEVPIHKRNIGLVFQNYALFPHKNIFDNVGFGLKYRRIERSAIAERVKRALDIVRLPGVEQKLPSELSGGQQQRVALARAIVIEPDVLLLDEPLSALDANLREDMRIELKSIQRELGITTVFVTHDQEEALAMSDRVVVMDDGVVEQTGAPEEVYRWPASRFVANFLGQSNILPGEVESASRSCRHGATLQWRAHERRPWRRCRRAGHKVSVVARAHRVIVGPPAPAAPTASPGRFRASPISAAPAPISSSPTASGSRPSTPSTAACFARAMRSASPSRRRIACCWTRRDGGSGRSDTSLKTGGWR